MFSGSCETAHEEADAGDQHPGFSAFDGGLKVFCQATIAPEPGEAALDHPAFRLGLERADALRSGDDLDRPRAQASERIDEFFTAIDAIGEDVPQLGERYVRAR